MQDIYEISDRYTVVCRTVVILIAASQAMTLKCVVVLWWSDHTRPSTLMSHSNFKRDSSFENAVMTHHEKGPIV